MHGFRCEVFVRRFGRSPPLIDGIEPDAFDNESAVYFVTRDSAQNITASARILPTTVPYMLSEVFPHLLGDMAPPCDPTVWELSRLATNVRSTGEGRILSLSQSTLDLLESVVEYARSCLVSRIVMVISPTIERLLLRAKFDIRRLGAPAQTQGAGLVVATYLQVPALPVKKRRTA